jgi:hypothetical protein
MPLIAAGDPSLTRKSGVSASIGEELAYPAEGLTPPSRTGSDRLRRYLGFLDRRNSWNLERIPSPPNRAARVSKRWLALLNP